MLAEIEKALTDHVAAIPASMAGDVQYEGRAYRPREGQPYLTVKVVASRRPMAQAADTPHMWTGSLQLSVVSPAAFGKPEAVRRADILLARFPRGTTLQAGAATVVCESGDIQPAYTAADWIFVPLVIPWFCEEP